MITKIETSFVAHFPFEHCDSIQTILSPTSQHCSRCDVIQKVYSPNFTIFLLCCDQRLAVDCLSRYCRPSTLTKIVSSRST